MSAGIEGSALLPLLDDEQLLQLAQQETQAMAAVMVLLDIEKHSLLVIHKADYLRRHAGEVAFAGGKLEAGETLLQCAQRECQEEVAISPEQYQLLGALPRRVTRHKMAVYPFVALLNPGYTVRIDEVEIQDAFLIPVAVLSDEKNHRQRMADIDGQPMLLDYFDYCRDMPDGDKNYQIWGVTAHIIRDLLKANIAQLMPDSKKLKG